MEAAISSTGRGLDSPVDARFGRARYFVIVDTETRRVLRVIDNQHNADAQAGAGVSSAQQICAAGAEVVLTGNVGPKAQQVLEAAGIRIHTGMTGTLLEALDALEAGFSAPRGAATARAGARGMGKAGRSGQFGGGRGRGGGR